MASTIILSDNGASSGSAGLKSTAGNDGVLILQTTTSGGTATNAVYIDTSQNVGIGTSSPATALEVKGSSPSINVNGTTSGSFRGYSIRSNGTEIASLLAEASGGENRMTAGFSGFGGFQTFYTNGLERARIDSSGNVGINITPSAWGTSYRALQFNGGSLFSSTSNSAMYIIQNGYFNGTNWTGISTAPASIYTQSAGVHTFYSDSVTSGASFTPTERMRIDASGNLKFNSGYGSAATAYGVRAWAQLIGTGAGNVFNGQGNFSSASRSTTGNFQLNFATALPDANYTVQANSWQATSTSNVDFNIYSLGTTAFALQTFESGALANPNYLLITVVR